MLSLIVIYSLEIYLKLLYDARQVIVMHTLICSKDEFLCSRIPRLLSGFIQCEIIYIVAYDPSAHLMHQSITISKRVGVSLTPDKRWICGYKMLDPSPLHILFLSRRWLMTILCSVVAPKHLYCTIIKLFRILQTTRWYSNASFWYFGSPVPWTWRLSRYFTVFASQSVVLWKNQFALIVFFRRRADPTVQSRVSPKTQRGIISPSLHRTVCTYWVIQLEASEPVSRENHGQLRGKRKGGRGETEWSC